ncbi:MAG: peptidase S41, partial [Treponema lecithinolyticum]
MKSEKTFALSRPFFTVLCPLIFALCIIYVPSGFAQAVQSSAAEKDARNRQYLELLNSVYT